MLKLMTETDPDQELVAHAQAGDREAYAELSARYRATLEALAGSLLSPALRRRLPVEDVVQETLARGLASLERFRWSGDGSFLRWLGTIARNIIADAARRDPKSLELSVDIPASPTSPSRRLRREERLERLEGALDALTPPKREVIRLFRLEGVRIREIAARTGRSEDAVKQLLARGLRSLRKSFGDTESLRLPRRESTGDGAQETSR